MATHSKISPRPYQRFATKQVLSYAAEHPNGRVLLVIPTRGGKTLVGSMLVKDMAVANGLRALWLVHREELLDEAVNHLRQVGIHELSIGVIKNGRSTNADAKVQVASECTLVRRDRPEAHIVVTDEAHRDTSPRRRMIRKAYPNAFLIGLTATPKPPPRRDLGEDYDTLMVVVQPSELIHDGFMCAPTIYAPNREDVPDMRNVRCIGGDYAVADMEPLLLNAELIDAQIKEWSRLCNQRTTIVYAVTRAHSTAIVDRFVANGVPAVHLDGHTPDAERRQTIDGVRNGNVPVVSSVGVLSEGTNLHSVKCILGVRPTRSLSLYIQQSMRCATPWNGVKPIVLDVVGNIYRHGFPSDDRVWSLKNNESGKPVNGAGNRIKRCGKCGAMSRANAQQCSSCNAPFGVEMPIHIVENISNVELHEMLPQVDKFAAERERLIEYATMRKFAMPEAWASKVLIAKYGDAYGPS